jgi:PPOX class probable F420-dependent enzyme
MPPTTLSTRERTLLDTARVARLATIGPTGRPHLVPVCYALVEAGDALALAIAVDEKPKRSTELARAANLQRDPRAAFLVDAYDDDWSRLAWIRIDVDGSVLPRGDAWPAALHALRLRYPQYRSMALEDRPLLRLLPVRAVSWFARP